jgi:hypothetical protein
MLPAAALPADLAASHDLLHTLLDVSLTPVNVLRPLYDPAGELVDFALVYVNPAGQRTNGLPEHPQGTLLTQFPHTKAAGIFDYYRRVYAEGATGGTKSTTKRTASTITSAWPLSVAATC